MRSNIREQSDELELAGLEELERVSLCEALDRILNKGAVVAGEISISVADVELVYLDLQLVIASIESVRGLPDLQALRPAAPELSAVGMSLALAAKEE